MNQNYLEGLNPKQQEAVTAPLVPLLILAGAGSGKTRVLVNRIAWLLETQDLSLSSILAVTFTNKAAGEMRHRLQALLSRPVGELWVGTFHGLCHRLLRRHYEAARLPEHFQILDSDDQVRIVKQILQDMHLDVEKWPPKAAVAFINSKKEEGIRSKHVSVQSYGPGRTYLAIYEAYEQACQRLGVVDFAELLLRTCELLRDNAELLAHYQARFKAILVDEFQDTNTVQYAWVRLLAGNKAVVTVVGDDDQSIYGWRGAKLEHILQFERDFPHTKVIRLEQNYRSTATILAGANQLIANNPDRMGKTLWTAGDKGEKIVIYGAYNEIEEARFVAEQIQLALEKEGLASDIAILYRSNAQSRVLEEALLRQNIAYRIYGGVRFFERAEIKDALAYLRLVLNQQDDPAFERIVNVPARGVGEKTLEVLREQVKTQGGSLWQAMEAQLLLAALPTRARTALSQFKQLIESLKQNFTQGEFEEKLFNLIEQTGLIPYYQNMKHEGGETRVENLKELVNAAKQFQYEETSEGDMSIELAFLSRASLEAGELQAQDHTPAVHLMTIHAAKGLEFPFVFMVGVEEGVFPSKASLEDPKRLEEERRLCYVGMTRAMKKLVMTYAEVRRQYGREEYHRPSRFIKELPAEMVNAIRGQDKKEKFSAIKAGVHSTQGQNKIVGKKVRHPLFGAGTVLASEGSGAHERVQVKFQETGVKWLVLAYANLAVEFT